MTDADIDAITLDTAEPDEVDVRIQFYDGHDVPHLNVHAAGRDHYREHCHAWKVSIGRTGRVAFARDFSIREYTPQLKDDEGRPLFVDRATGEHTTEETYHDDNGRHQWRNKALATDKALDARGRYEVDHGWANRHLTTNVYT